MFFVGRFAARHVCKHGETASAVYPLSIRYLSNGDDSSIAVGTPNASRVVPLLPRQRRHERPRGQNAESVGFVDWCRVSVRGGQGGDGAVSLGRVYGNAMAGPDGGDGGAGGHVLFIASTSRSSLSHVRPVLRADDGGHGRGENCNGRGAENQMIQVPLGTMFSSANGSIVASVEREGDVFVAARGGAGGRGNCFFASSTMQTPRYAERGAAGESISYSIELRTIADIGLIGFPNAGKSTLLRAVSRARPRVANYPFTTLRPHVGVVQYSDLSQLAWADIPGLIAGAHRNRGLGSSFLRHVQRCSCLLYVLDGSDSPAQQFEVLQQELRLYDEQLAQRAAAVVVNKIDLPQTQECIADIERATDLPVLTLAAKFGTNVTELLIRMKEIYDAYKEQRCVNSSSSDDSHSVVERGL